MEIFDTFERTYQGPAVHGEGEFSFLNRSARPAAGIVRRTVEAWFTEFCEDERERLRTDLRTGFYPGLFELVIHRYLSTVAGEPTCHPQLKCSERKPDFMVVFDRESVIVEATVCLDGRTDEPDDADSVNASVEGDLLNAVNEIDSPDFFICVNRIRSPGGRQPSTRRMKAFLSRVVAELQWSEDCSVSSKTFSDDGVTINFQFVAKSAGIRGVKHIRNLGSSPPKSRWGGSASALLNVLSKKATRYGELEVPYVIAVNVLSPWGLDSDDVDNALFGSESYVVAKGETEPTLRRNPDGLWRGPGGPKNTRVSAVAITTFVPWNLSSARLRLIENPWASRPCGRLPWRLTANDSGPTLGTILGLPSGWPGEIFD